MIYDHSVILVYWFPMRHIEFQPHGSGLGFGFIFVFFIMRLHWVQKYPPSLSTNIADALDILLFTSVCSLSTSEMHLLTFTGSKLGGSQLLNELLKLGIYILHVHLRGHVYNHIFRKDTSVRPEMKKPILLLSLFHIFASSICYIHAFR